MSELIVSIAPLSSFWFVDVIALAVLSPTPALIQNGVGCTGHLLVVLENNLDPLVPPTLRLSAQPSGAAGLAGSLRLVAIMPSACHVLMRTGASPQPLLGSLPPSAPCQACRLPIQG